MSHQRMRGPKLFKTITPEVAAAIFELHEKHPKLGHDGLLRLLEEDRGFDIDADELTTFLDEHEIHGERFVQSWRRVGAGYFMSSPTMGGTIL